MTFGKPAIACSSYEAWGWSLWALIGTAVGGGVVTGCWDLLSHLRKAKLNPFSTSLGLEKRGDKIFIFLGDKKIPLLHSVKK